MARKKSTLVDEGYTFEQYHSIDKRYIWGQKVFWTKKEAIDWVLQNWMYMWKKHLDLSRIIHAQYELSPHERAKAWAYIKCVLKLRVFKAKFTVEQIS